MSLLHAFHFSPSLILLLGRISPAVVLLGNLLLKKQSPEGANIVNNE
jgi:hypothetical protein